MRLNKINIKTNVKKGYKSTLFSKLHYNISSIVVGGSRPFFNFGYPPDSLFVFQFRAHF